MNDTMKKIADYNLWGADRKIIDTEATEAITDLALDPINLSSRSAVIDLPFVSAGSGSR